MIDCSNSMAPDDEELLAYVFGEETLNEGRKQHLEHCPTCQERLKDYQQMNEMYLSRLYRTLCPSATQLTLYCANALSADERFDIAEHLRECLLCSDEVRGIRHEMALFTPFPEPPVPSLRQTAQEVKRIVASLVQPAYPARRELSSLPWPRYYQAGNTNLSLHISRTANNQLMLLGNFLSNDEEQLKTLEDSVADLYQLENPSASPATILSDRLAERPLMSTVVDRLGHFSFAPLRAGIYALRIYLPDTELLIEQVQLE